MVKHISCSCKWKFDCATYNSNQKWNNDTCPKPDFPDNLKKYKTKTIPKNSNLFKPKYDFKNKI